MKIAVPSEQHIRAQLDALLKKEPGLEAMALRSPQAGRWPDQIERQGRTFRLTWVESELAIRQALRNADGTEGLVLMTSLSEADLGDDILARFARGRVFEIESWRMLQDAFQARHVDPRLRGQGWIADVLLEHQPVGGYPPVPGGVLDADTAWRHVLQRAIGLEDSRPDILLLLRWAVSEGSLYRLTKLRPDVQEAITRHLAAIAGPAGALFMRAVAAGHGSLVVPLGLVADVLFFETDDPNGEIGQAITRLEGFFDRHRPGRGAALAWAAASIAVAKAANPDVALAWYGEAHRVLREVGAAAYMGRSRILPEAFDERLKALAEAFTAALAQKFTPLALEAVEDRARQVLAHEQASLQLPRVERVRMAVRLVRWLAVDDAVGPLFQDLARNYATDSGFADRVRLSLRGGDESALLSAAYLHLLEAVRKRRHTENALFAHALKDWNTAPQSMDDIVPVEDVLDRVVTPLASTVPVLLLVMDGLSFPIFRELTDALAGDSWQSLRREGAAPLRAAVAALPTRTEVSRASLLCGKLTLGAANVERKGFSSHPGLLKASRSGRPPIVFHKGDLTDGATALSNEVRQALSDSQQRVVGVVYNAVDDHLSGSDQLRLTWGLGNLHLLRPILHEARSAGRVVIITADHGHVIEDGSVTVSQGDSDRWRRTGAAIQEGEIELGGGRVQVPPHHAAVLAWSEGLRYASKKNGYHGGASPQEVLVPLSVFASGGLPKGWTHDAPVEPDWWIGPLDTGPVAPLPAAPSSAKAAPRRRAPQPSGQASLFADPPEVAAPPPAPMSTASWLDALFASETYMAQAQMAGPNRPTDALLRLFIEALADRGRMATPVLAKRVELALFRMPGFISQASRVLNVDQTPVVVYDSAGQMVELDVRLLRDQFEIGG